MYKNIDDRYVIKSIALFAAIFFISSLLAAVPVLADGWASSQPSHATLYSDTITSKTDASPVSIADSQGLFVTGDVTTLGKVGVGTTNPGAKLDVRGDGIAAPSMQVQRGWDGGRVRFQYAGTSDGYGEIGQTYFAAGKTAIWIGSNLNSFAGSHQGATQGNSNGPSWYARFDSISDQFFVSRIAPGGGDDSKLLIDGNGNVGIGTTGPGSLLELSSANSRLWVGSTAVDSLTNIALANDVQTWLIRNVGTDSDKFVIRNNNLDRDDLVITTAGNVGIGTASPGYKLDVAGDAHATSFPTSSDIRLKKNISQITNALGKLQNIHGVGFEWNDKYKELGRATSGKQIGIIAQELEKEFPELVTSWGNESYKAVDYGRFSAVLLEAIKELKAENEALKKRIEVLEAG